MDNGITTNRSAKNHGGKMKIALIHDHFEEAHLENIKAEMCKLGAPTIKAVWLEHLGAWAALEGCHRIRAAKKLGITPEIEEIEYSEDITTDDLDISEAFGGDVWTIASLVDDAHTREILEFNK
jgi:hypothetical protein